MLYSRPATFLIWSAITAVMMVLGCASAPEHAYQSHPLEFSYMWEERRGFTTPETNSARVSVEGSQVRIEGFVLIPCSGVNLAAAHGRYANELSLSLYLPPEQFCMPLGSRTIRFVAVFGEVSPGRYTVVASFNPLPPVAHSIVREEVVVPPH